MSQIEDAAAKEAGGTKVFVKIGNDGKEDYRDLIISYPRKDFGFIYSTTDKKITASRSIETNNFKQITGREEIEAAFKRFKGGFNVRGDVQVDLKAII